MRLILKRTMDQAYAWGPSTFTAREKAHLDRDLSAGGMKNMCKILKWFFMFLFISE